MDRLLDAFDSICSKYSQIGPSAGPFVDLTDSDNLRKYARYKAPPPRPHFLVDPASLAIQTDLADTSFDVATNTTTTTTHKHPAQLMQTQALYIQQHIRNPLPRDDNDDLFQHVEDDENRYYYGFKQRCANNMFGRNVSGAAQVTEPILHDFIRFLIRRRRCLWMIRKPAGTGNSSTSKNSHSEICMAIEFLCDATEGEYDAMNKLRTKAKRGRKRKTPLPDSDDDVAVDPTFRPSSTVVATMTTTTAAPTTTTTTTTTTNDTGHQELPLLEQQPSTQVTQSTVIPFDQDKDRIKWTIVGKRRLLRALRHYYPHDSSHARVQLYGLKRTWRIIITERVWRKIEGVMPLDVKSGDVDRLKKCRDRCEWDSDVCLVALHAGFDETGVNEHVGHVASDGTHV